MQSQRLMRTPLMGVSLVILLFTAIMATAKNGRDFAGVYNVSSAVEQGDQMVVTFRVHLFNNSDADLKGAVVKLHTLDPGLAAPAAFKPVALWRNRTEVRLTQQFTVSKHEFERWHHGSQPALFVVYRDKQGQRWERYVQVTGRPALPE